VFVPARRRWLHRGILLLDGDAAIPVGYARRAAEPSKVAGVTIAGVDGVADHAGALHGAGRLQPVPLWLAWLAHANAPVRTPPPAATSPASPARLRDRIDLWSPCCSRPGPPPEHGRQSAEPGGRCSIGKAWRRSCSDRRAPTATFRRRPHTDHRFGPVADGILAQRARRFRMSPAPDPPRGARGSHHRRPRRLERGGPGAHRRGAHLPRRGNS